MARALTVVTVVSSAFVLCPTPTAAHSRRPRAVTSTSVSRRSTAAAWAGSKLLARFPLSVNVLALIALIVNVSLAESASRRTTV